MVKMLMGLIASLFLTATLSAKTLVLSEKNTVVMRSAFTDQSVAKVVAELLAKNASLPTGEPLYLFIDSPGGSVTAGMDLIQAVKGLGREVKTVTSFAASMAFITVQALGERFIMPNGVLMSHRARGGVDGQIPGEIDTRYQFWRKYLDRINVDVAGRVGLTYDQYMSTIWNEWWVEGEDAIAQKAADQVVDVKCDKSMNGTTKDTVSTIFGPIEVVYHMCPLVKAPLKVNMGAVAFAGMNEAEKREYNEATSSYFYNKSLFLHKYVITGQFNRIFN